MPEGWHMYGITKCEVCAGPVDIAAGQHIDADGELMGYRETVIWCHRAKPPEEVIPEGPPLPQGLSFPDPREAHFLRHLKNNQEFKS